MVQVFSFSILSSAYHLAASATLSTDQFVMLPNCQCLIISCKATHRTVIVKFGAEITLKVVENLCLRSFLGNPKVGAGKRAV